MPAPIYELISQGARYWFLLLMLIIAWRSWRWYRKDRRQARKRLKLLPDAGFVGEMIITTASGNAQRGDTLMVPREGTLGASRTNDLCVQAPGVAKRHLWFRFEGDQGLLVEPFGKNAVRVDGTPFAPKADPLYMSHGSWLQVGECEMRLRLFAGFESAGHAQRRLEEPAPAAQQPPAMDPAQMAAMQQWMLQQQWLAQQAYQQGYAQAVAQMEPADEPGSPQPMPETDEYEYPAPLAQDELPYDMAQIAQEEGMVDHRMFMRPEGQPKPQLPVYEAPPAPAPQFYPPVMNDGDEADADMEMEMDLPPEPDAPWSPHDEDMTDAAAPPKSAYVGRDEAEAAKRAVWDKYFGGGQKR